VAVVTRDPQQRVFDAVLHAVEHEVVLIESVAHAYAHIKRAAPDLVIVCVMSNDIEGCRLLSMLALDSETAHIPVLTYFSEASDVADPEDDEEDADVFSLFRAGQLN
jgi:CheY-like chemotaxis protein